MDVNKKIKIISTAEIILSGLKSYLEPPPYTNLSQTSLGTLNHTSGASGAPEALIRATKNSKHALHSHTFPYLILDGQN